MTLKEHQDRIRRTTLMAVARGMRAEAYIDGQRIAPTKAEAEAELKRMGHAEPRKPEEKAS